MTKKIKLPKITDNGGTQTPTSKGIKSLIGQPGIPAQSKNGSNYVNISLTEEVLNGGPNFNYQLGDNKPLPAQAKAICYHIALLGGVNVKQKDLLKALDDRENGHLVSTQDSDRVLRFYRKRLINEGFITLS